MSKGARLMNPLLLSLLRIAAVNPLQVDNQIAAIQAALDQRLSSMAPSTRQVYNELLAEQATLLTEAARFEEDLAQLSEALAAAEGELGRNQVKQRALQIQVGWHSNRQVHNCFRGVLADCWVATQVV